jgi:hypothetical protein
MGLHPIWRWFHNHGLCSTDIWRQNQKSLSEKMHENNNIGYRIVQCCVDRHHDNDPNPDQTFHFDADPNPDPTSVLHMLENQKKSTFSQQCRFTSLFRIFFVIGIGAIIFNI